MKTSKIPDHKEHPKKQKKKRDDTLFTHAAFLDLYDIRLRNTASPYIKSIKLRGEVILVDTRVYSDRSIIRLLFQGSKQWEEYDRLHFVHWVYQKLGKPFKL